MNTTPSTKKRILACGTFDLLHPGHIDFLKQAAALGEELHVCIARDTNVLRIKKHLPLWNEDRRAAALEALDFVDHVHLGHEHDFLQPVEQIAPDLLALGYDQRIPEDVQSYLDHQDLPTMRLRSYYPAQYKSSILRAALRA